MKNHWTHYLSEAGTIKDIGKYQMFLLERIKTVTSDLNLLQEEYRLNEIKIQKKALKNWSSEEIDEARAEAIITQRTKAEKAAIAKMLEDNEKFSSLLNPVKNVSKNTPVRIRKTKK